MPYDDIIDNPSRMLENLSRFLGLAFDEKKLMPAFKKMFNTLDVEYFPGPEVMARLDDLEEHFEKMNGNYATLKNYLGRFLTVV